MLPIAKIGGLANVVEVVLKYQNMLIEEIALLCLFVICFLG